MSPTPFNSSSNMKDAPTGTGPAPHSPETVVISGMSGLYPMSDNVQEFATILYNKINPVNNEHKRWTQKHPESSDYIGMAPGLDRFDAQFFMVHKNLAVAMDPIGRKILEQSYQAIYDAGLSPQHLRGKRVGVYVGADFSVTEVLETVDKSHITGYGITGSSKAMYSNRVSYWLNAKGPSITIDDACCGSLVALEEAFKAIHSGLIESAIVAGASICLVPHPLIHYRRMFNMAPDGKTRSFDQKANGCVKSDAISVLFLQKAKHACRVYAEVINVKNQYLHGNTGENGQIFGFTRNPDITSEFLRDFYSTSRVSPSDVEYIEACGFAISEADKNELQSIEKVFCQKRVDPLLVGSVMSNIGFTDAATGATGITKVLLAYQRGLVASNINCESPREDIEALRDGRMRLVTQHAPFRGTYAALNCMSYSGVNSHVLLRGCSKPKDLTRYATTIPRLVTVSARQKPHLKDILLDLQMRSIDPEEIALLHNIHSRNISGHLGRGYILLDADKDGQAMKVSQSMEHSDASSRPLWFVYSGMGSQWAGMGAQLMRIPIFAATIQRCHKALEPKGIDIVHIITSPDKTIFDNVLNSFVGIAAIQIGITDILNALQLHPEKIIGHSVGELGCAYADGSLTAEEMILSAYSRGKASNDTKMIRGAMAAIGLGYKQLSKLCPPSIEIACHNSATSSTISGPEDSIREFVSMLTANGIFAKEVPSANIAYHSQYIADAGPLLTQLLSEIIKEPKPRSNRWLSTSVPQDKWNNESAKFCSSEYLTNNLLSPVLFEETSSLIPNNAVLIEIAPHGLLQAILKRALPDTCTNIPLTHRGHKDNVVFLLEAIGRLYVEGYTPDLQAIYPKVEFPVSVQTPTLSQFVQWNHDDVWEQVQGKQRSKQAAACEVRINIHDDEYSYLTGNVIQGQTIFPFAGTLVAVWDTLAMTLGYPKRKMPIRFSDVHLYSQPILKDLKPLDLSVSIHRGSGRFEVINGDSKVVTGYVEELLEPSFECLTDSSRDLDISAEEIYDYLKSRGYSYRDDFVSVASIDETVDNAVLFWKDNWVTFLDGLLQLNLLKSTHSGSAQPFQFRELTIDVESHAQLIQQNELSGKNTFPARVDEIHDTTRCGGVVLQYLKIHNVPSHKEVIFQLSIPTEIIPNINDSTERKLTHENKLSLQIGEIGNIETLHWEEKPQNLAKNYIKVLVEYAGINISDTNKAYGVTHFEATKPCFGMDFSGVTEHGERVMGLVHEGAASTLVAAQPELVWPVPRHWTLEEAATVPLAYTQAFYYLCVKNELVRGWKVLVHGAAGALGQAAVAVALAHGCKVFATVSNAAKKKLLLKLFPQLHENDIGNSRNDSFGDMILNATDGQGCNIIISCVKGDLKNISLKCAGFSGVTIDMVQIQDREKFEYGMFNMTKQRSYMAADFYSLLEAGKVEELSKLQMLVLEGISRGYVRPLTRISFGPHEAARAFRLLAASNHRGRVLLHVRDSLARVTPRITCSSKNAQVIVWDGSTFGLQLADRLIDRGAKTIRFLCLTPNTHLRLKLRSWKKAGVDVEVKTEKVADADFIHWYLNKICTETPIEGVYVTLSDTDWNHNKETIIKNLDASIRALQYPLKYFVAVSSDRNRGSEVCLSRANDGLPATSLLVPNFKKEEMGLKSLIDEHDWNRSALNVMELALRSKHPVLFAQSKTIETPCLVKLFPVLADLENEDIAIKYLALADLAPAIQSFLKNAYNVYLDNQHVLSLTKKHEPSAYIVTMYPDFLTVKGDPCRPSLQADCINQPSGREPKLQIANITLILKIEAIASTDVELKTEKGLDMYFSIKEHDELKATTELYPMDSIITDVEATLGAIETDNPHNMFIIPGIEGHYGRFLGLCKSLKMSAFVLQQRLESPHETPKETAVRYSEILLKQFKLKKRFYLLAHEFGLNIALELTAILEDHGYIGTVYCIGDGPEEMKTLLSSVLASFKTETELQEALVRTIFSQMTKDCISSLEVALRGCATWQDRIDACVRLLLGKAPHTAQYIESLLKVALARLHIAQKGTPVARVLQSQFVLLRARSDSDGTSPCSLQRYSQQKLVIHDLNVPLAHAAADPRVPAIVNKYLDAELLANYERRNVCQPYIFIG